MGVPREDLLLMTRALKRGIADLKAIRKALDRQISKPISLLEALHLGAAEAQALRADATLPDPLQDRPLLNSLQVVLLEGEHLTALEWEKFTASLMRPTSRAGYPPLLVPQEFGGYSLQWELARRERGVLYRARDAEGRDLAIKIFRKDVPVTAPLPQVEGHAYSVMPFVDGESLEAKRPASPRRAAQTIETAAHLLRGCSHGALSPARILVRKNDSVVLVGFEHARAVPLSARARVYGGGDDVHALGAILYELLVGTPPASETSPAARSRDVDAQLDRIVSCALEGGYGSTGELADDLGRYVRGEPVTARRSASPAAGKKKPWGLVAAALLLVAGAVAGVAIMISTKANPPEAKNPTAPEEPKAALRQSGPPAEPPKPKPPPKFEEPKTAAKKPLTSEEDDALYAAGMEASFAADWEQVLRIGNDAVARGSKKDWAYHLATAYAERDELDKALEYATRALEASGDKRLALEKRAEVYALRGEVRRALADLEALHGKKVKEIHDQIRKLSKQKPEARTLLALGAYYCLKKHYEEAEKNFAAALELGLKSALVWRAFARMNEDNRRADAVVDLRAYQAALPNGYATEEVSSLLKDLRAR